MGSVVVIGYMRAHSVVEVLQRKQGYQLTYPTRRRAKYRENSKVEESFFTSSMAPFSSDENFGSPRVMETANAQYIK